MKKRKGKSRAAASSGAEEEVDDGEGKLEQGCDLASSAEMSMCPEARRGCT